MKNGVGGDKHIKVTFGAIEKMHYSDFNSGLEGQDFRPEDIVDIEDHAEDEVLSKFKSQQRYDYNAPQQYSTHRGAKTLNNSSMAN